MSVETAQFIHQLNSSYPSGSDRLKEGDDHLRLIKATLKATFPGITGPLDASVTHTFLNALKASLVPFGTIAMHYGEAAPDGWALCNGQTVPKSDGTGNFTTPDFRNRVPFGASADHALLSTFGQASRTITTEAAGSHAHTAGTALAGAHGHQVTVAGTALSVDQMPAHNHGNGVADDNVGNVFPYGTKSGPSGGNLSNGSGGNSTQGLTETVGGGKQHTHDATSSEAGAHSHGVTVDAAGSHSHSATIDVTQPSLAVNFIIKI